MHTLGKLIAGFLLISTTLTLAEEPRPGRQVEQKLMLGEDRYIDYLLYLPEDYEPGKKFAFLLFLHGRGESYGPLSIVKKWGPPRLVDEGRKMPYIIASPQCPESPARWSAFDEQVKLVQLLQHLEEQYAIDKTRMYLTGLSMGGFGSWTLAAHLPNKFAAVAPICGRGNPEDAAKLKDIPIWAWHGLEDEAVPPSGSKKMVKAIKKAGGRKIRYTTLEGVGHNSWSAAYATPGLYEWFDSHQRQP